MLVNEDFAQRVVVIPERYQWIESPEQGVERVMLDRIGGEIARATSIVRYRPRSNFPAHCHPGGEEILVLSGVFSERSANYAAGWYLRNPPGSSHQPFTVEGAIIFVKLCQMSANERRIVRVNTAQSTRWRKQLGREECGLFNSDSEHVKLLRLRPGEALFDRSVDSAEILLLAGRLHMENESYLRGSWIRLPAGKYPQFVAGISGAALYVKTGHLPLTATTVTATLATTRSRHASDGAGETGGN